jgi:hypothetical protein
MKGLKPLKGFESSRGRREPLLIGEKQDYGRLDPRVQQVLSTMGGRPRDEKVAERVVKLMDKGVGNALTSGTVPELVVYDWLQRKGIPFEFQVEVRGGRSSAGGSVVDFIVRSGRTWAWRIQTWYHTLPEKRARDEIQKRLLQGALVQGYQIDGVVDVWDMRIYQDKENTLTQATVGIELGE